MTMLMSLADDRRAAEDDCRIATTMPKAATATPRAQAHGWSVHAP